jgi:ribose 5-phosphate isomerase B
MGGWFVAPELGIQMVKAFLGTAHTQDLEEWRQKFLKDAKNRFLSLEDEIYSNGGTN